MSLQISFAKLEDDTWGVRVYDPRKSGGHLGLTGQTVEVEKRDGTTKTVTLGEMAFQGNGDKGYYRTAGSKPKTSAETDKSTAPKPPSPPVNTDERLANLEQVVLGQHQRIKDLEAAMAALLRSEEVPTNR